MNSQPSIKAYDWTNRQVITATLFIVAVVTLFGLLYQFRLAVFILLVGVVLGTAIHPAVEALTRRGVPKSAAVAALFFVLLLAIGGVLMLVVPLLANQAADIAGSVPEYYSQLRQTMVTSPNIFLHRLAFRLPETLSMSAPPPIEADETVLTQASTFFNFMQVTLQSILLTLAAFLISFYWTLESRRIIQQGLLYAPMKQRENIRSFLQAIEEKVGGYVRGQGILCLAIGLLSFVAYLVIGLPYALVLALIAGIMEAIPVFGPTLGAIPAIMVAFSVDPSTVVWVVVATIIIQLLENNLLVPRIMNKVVGVNSMVVLLALVTLAPLLGLAGVVLAIPMAAVVQLLLDRFVWAGEHSLEHLPTGRDQISKLRYEAQALGRDVRKQLKEKDDPASADSDEIEDSIEAITMELDRLLEKMANQEAAP